MDQGKIGHIREDWEKLKLDLLIPVQLSDEQCMAIVSGRENRREAGFFSHMSGATVAHFKEAAANEIMAWARTQSHMRHDRMDAGGDEYVYGMSVRFLDDIEKIHRTIFRRGYVAPGGTDIGLFFHELGGAHLMHQDRQGNNNPFYTARLGDLPMLYISGKNHKKYDPIVRETRRSRSKLLKMGALEEASLGDVVMAFTSSEAVPHRGGTWHCGSPVPRGGSHSAFFRAWTINMGL